MSWFDSKKFQDIAKSTLLQAQKQIDKVLDIKEDEITGTASSTSTSNKQLEIKIPDSQPTEASETDNFFNNFIGQPLQLVTQPPNFNKSNSSKPTTPNQLPNDINFEEFLNQDSKSEPKLKINTTLSPRDGKSWFNHYLNNRFVIY